MYGFPENLRDIWYCMESFNIVFPLIYNISSISSTGFSRKYIQYFYFSIFIYDKTACCMIYKTENFIKWNSITEIKNLKLWPYSTKHIFYLNSDIFRKPEHSQETWTLSGISNILENLENLKSQKIFLFPSRPDLTRSYNYYVYSIINISNNYDDVQWYSR